MNEREEEILNQKTEIENIINEISDDETAIKILNKENYITNPGYVHEYLFVIDFVTEKRTCKARYKLQMQISETLGYEISLDVISRRLEVAKLCKTKRASYEDLLIKLRDLINMCVEMAKP